ncbi:MAG TPA: hypothetical protein VMR46_01985 [Candidatus Paceibacterota bacterium]|nr:hypothetical protein [Candidatus Paceibacterota bacterium]
MPEKDKKFHEFALKSILFKGQRDLYFCYVKSEKIAHVLSLLEERTSVESAAHLKGLVASASRLPETIAHFAAGEIELAVVLADLFSLLSAVRLGNTKGAIHEENAALIAAEYEALAERLIGGARLSPFVTSEDFLLPQLAGDEPQTPPQLSDGRSRTELYIKDNKGQVKETRLTNKGHVQGHAVGESKRAPLILGFVRKHTGCSIKDISRAVKGCSEKTIQRELATLIEHGLVEKRGERRWSIYYPR